MASSKPRVIHWISLLIVAVFISSASCFYLPGVAPHEYQLNDTVPLLVVKLVSSQTQIPYDYYALNFCPNKNLELVHENLGEFLAGDRIESSPYEVKAQIKEVCKLLCKREQTKEQLKEFEDRIREEYSVRWLLDFLPAAVKKSNLVGTKNVNVYQLGFPLGFVREDVAYINNHIHMIVGYHESADFEGIRIIRFAVEPQSILHDDFDPTEKPYPDSCVAPTPVPHPVSGPDAPDTIIFTYTVDWELDRNQRWASRWDVYLTVTDSQIHWVAIINSVMIAFFLTAMVAMIMMRTLRADLRRYHEMETQEEAQEETGWKLVHGDVFRPPSNPLFLSVLVGSGVQVITMASITLVFALLGFLSPENRGGLMTAMVVLYVLMGIFAGYFSARTYKTFKGQHWKKNTLLTALSFPGVCFLIFFILNLFLKHEHSSGYVPFKIMFGIFCLWFGVSIPLAFMGSYLGFKKPAPENPVRTNQIPRQIPEQVWYMQPWASCLMGGILPFGAIFIELFFILSSIWNHQFYYMFGFLFIVFIILALTCSEITIVMCYFQLCSEDYHWWWRSYMTAGTSAFYMFLYAIFYFFTKLHITKFVSVLLYFGYTTIMTLAFFVLTGTIGFYSCYWFVRKIYGSVKVD